jgi:hypothetical protein
MITSLDSAADSVYGGYSTLNQLLDHAHADSRNRDSWHRLNDVALTPESRDNDWFHYTMQRAAATFDVDRSAKGGLLPLPVTKPQIGVPSPTWSFTEEASDKYLGFSNNELHKAFNWRYPDLELPSQQCQNQPQSAILAKTVRR